MDEARRLAPQMPSPHLTARLPAAVWSLRSKPCTVELPEGFEARNEQLAKALAEAADAQVEAQNIMEAQRHLDLRNRGRASSEHQDKHERAIGQRSGPGGCAQASDRHKHCLKAAFREIVLRHGMRISNASACITERPLILAPPRHQPFPVSAPTPTSSHRSIVTISPVTSAHLSVLAVTQSQSGVTHGRHASLTLVFTAG